MTSACRNTSRNDLDVNISLLLLTPEIITLCLLLVILYHYVKILSLLIKVQQSEQEAPGPYSSHYCLCQTGGEWINEWMDGWMTTHGRKHSRWEVGVTLVLVPAASLITLPPCGNFSAFNSICHLCQQKWQKVQEKKKVEKIRNVPVTFKLIKTCFNHTGTISLRTLLFKLIETSASCLKNTFFTMKYVLSACCIQLSRLINESKIREHLFELIKLFLNGAISRYD